MRWLLVLLAILLIFSPLTAQEYNPDNGHYYQILDLLESSNWHEAKDSAISLGGYLCTVNSYNEMMFILDICSTANLSANAAFYLGGTDENSEGVWEWVSDETWDYEYWRDGEPNDHNGGEDYLIFGLSYDGKWNDVWDYYPYPTANFIVEWDCHPNTLHHVPADFPTIQGAIDVACDGDTVLVADGHYFERISFLGKSIVVASEYIFDPDTNHILNTIIDADESVIGHSDTGSVVAFINGEDTLAQLIGFTIQNGIGTLLETPVGTSGTFGGGIVLSQSSGTLMNLIIRNNSALTEGNAFASIVSESVTIDNCEIDNTCYNRWGVAINVLNTSINSTFYWRNGTTALFNNCNISMVDSYGSQGEVLDCNVNSVHAFFGEIDISNSTCNGIYSEYNSSITAINSTVGSTATADGASIGTTNCIITSVAGGYSYGGSQSHVNATVLEESSLINAYISFKRSKLYGDFISSTYSGLSFDSCEIFGNFSIGGSGPAVGGGLTFKSSTLLQSEIQVVGDFGNIKFYNSLAIGDNTILDNSSEFTGDLILDCSDFYCDLDWLSGQYSYLDTTNVYFENPLFCDTTTGEFNIMDASICAPDNNDCGILIGAFGVGCSAQPAISTFQINDETPGNVVIHTPSFGWSYTDPLEAKAQNQYEIAVGTDDDWGYAEMWNPAPIESADTFVVYNGSPLIDGQTYYARLRVNNGFAWSDWAEMSFRMNTPPTVPVMLSPVDSAVVASTQPFLWILNSLDAEGDDLFYDFQCYDDCLMYGGANIPQDIDSTGWMMDPSLYENGFFLWRTRAFDGFEYSEYSEPEYFFTNAIEQAPLPFTVTYPPDTAWSQVYDFPTTFTWIQTYDPDPLDSVHYRLLLSVDENFTFVATYDSLWTNSHTITLDYGTHYWWKVEAVDTKGNTTESTNTADFLTWVLGDVNADGSVNIGDAVFLITHIFKGGPAPNPIRIGDTNGDCSVNIGDAVYMVNYIFGGGSPPGIGCAE